MSKTPPRHTRIRWGLYGRPGLAIYRRRYCLSFSTFEPWHWRPDFFSWGSIGGCIVSWGRWQIEYNPHEPDDEWGIEFEAFRADVARTMPEIARQIDEVFDLSNTPDRRASALDRSTPEGP